MGTGISTNIPLRKDIIACLKSHGIEFVFRYYAAKTNDSDKRLTLAEAQRLSSAGLQIGTVFENAGADKLKYFTCDQGTDDGTDSVAIARKLGQPDGSGIYFAADFEVKQSQIKTLVAYFENVLKAMTTAGGGTNPYRIGVYGEGLLCATLLEKKLVSLTWLSESTGFPGTHDFKNWNVKQALAHVNLCGLHGSGNPAKDDYEDNVSKDDFGGWQLRGRKVPTIPAEPGPAEPASPYRVVSHSVLDLRSEPKIPAKNARGNIVARLPAGHHVSVMGEAPAKKWWKIETEIDRATFRGFAEAQHLEPASAPLVVPAPPRGAPEADSGNIPAVYMTEAAGHITRRRDPAGATSLNEPGQPTQQGTTPEDRKRDIAKIIAWLAVDSPQHRRYQPTAHSTFCNIYAHDYCYLSRVYLPRVWWTPRAIIRLEHGEQVPVRLGDTVEEQRANDLARWFRDHGANFDWHRVATLDDLQNAANRGGIGIIVARRTDDGKSGHIVAVVPEFDILAKRDGSGKVTAPVQSQAGSTNFQYGTGRPNWWLGSQFTEHGFWTHG